MVKTAKVSDFTGKREIAAGGEGKIFEHPSDNKQVVKIYHKPRPAKFVKHLESLSKLGNLCVSPKDIYVDNSGKCIGFSMAYVNFNDYFLFNNLFNKGFCNSHNITTQFKKTVLEVLANSLKDIHSKGIVVGDLNQYNLFFSKSASILLVDVDSYQTVDSPHSGVLLEDIRDWTTLSINDKTDIWSYDVLAFWATTFCHPFKWVVPGNTESLEMRVKSGKSILSKITNIKIPPLYEPPVGDILKQFGEIFTGRRYMVSFTGSYTPTSVVIKQSITSQSLNIRKLYENVTKINACSEYIAVYNPRLGWTLVETRMKGIIGEIRTIMSEDMFPSNSGNFATFSGNVLSGLNQTYRFQQPVYQYSDGSLIIIDYATDVQWNFNINNQLSGIDVTNTSVFAKSVVKRSGLIQNFGNQKYLNVPMNNSYTLMSIPKGTKDAYYHKGLIANEVRGLSQIEYNIVRPNYAIKQFDYLPYFTVTNTGMVIVPEDGFLDVYDKDFHLVTRFDCSLCTRDSKLYQTSSGIIMLEDKTVYLLNTK